MAEGDVRGMRLGVQSPAGDLAGRVIADFLELKPYRTEPYVKLVLGALAAQIGAANRADSVAEMTKAIDGLPDSENQLGKELMKQLMSTLPPAARSKIEKAGKAGSLFKELLTQARQVAADEKQPPAERAAAARTLRLADFAQVQGLLSDLLTFRQPAAVQRAALESLARFDEPKVPALVLPAWPGLSPQVRATAAETLFARSKWIDAFLDAVGDGKIKLADIDPARISVLQQTGDASQRVRIQRLFAKGQLSKRADVVAAYQKALDLKGDSGRGKAIFKKECSACRRLESRGAQTGPEPGALPDPRA